MLKDSQKGILLIITFFILTIILAVVLAVSTILYSEIKIIRNIGNSVVAFYAADSGVEKTLYYDRNKAPERAKRGLCNICNYFPGSDNGCPTDNADSSINCNNCQNIGSGCDSISCEDCEVSFDSLFNGKSYEITISTKTIDGLSDTKIDSKGSYKDVSRKIQAQIED
ncbi:MAG: hypothetical protein CEN87_60 [Parcubacteria group bacterium Licking1014_1]|nr:MAG: hypothetical protein CEN87_60 [Parcubacteria group bacterium Licking1014_1]